MHDEDFTVSNPYGLVEVHVMNSADTRPSHSQRKGCHLRSMKFVRSTTFLDIKIQVGLAYGVESTTFSLMRYSSNRRVGMSPNYMGTYMDPLSIGEICENRKLILEIVWHGY